MAWVLSGAMSVAIMNPISSVPALARPCTKNIPIITYTIGFSLGGKHTITKVARN